RRPITTHLLTTHHSLGQIQALDKIVVLLAVDTGLEARQHAGKVAGEQRLGVEPEAGKHAALVQAVSVRRHSLVRPASENEPVDRAVEDPPDDVFLHAAAA